MIYLCKPNGYVLGVLNGIDDNTASLSQSVADTWELTFEVNRYVSVNGEYVENDWYSSISEMMELMLDTDDVKAMFQIDMEPVVDSDGVQEKKVVTAHSIEVELATKILHNFNVNTGLKDSSQEYLVGHYVGDEFVYTNLDPYNQLPIDYLTIHCTLEDEMRDVLSYLQPLDLDIDPSDGLVRNTDVYPQLAELYTKYPRLSCDITDDGTGVLIYLYVVDIGETDPDYHGYRYKVYVGNNKAEDGSLEINDNTSQHSKEFLINGVNRLISFYHDYGYQLSILDLAIENAGAAGWSVGDVPDYIAKKKYTFSVEQQDILSFLKTVLSQTAKVIVDFDRIEKKVNIIDVIDNDDEYDTGVYVTFRNLMNSVSISSSSDAGIQTKFVPKGKDDVGIIYANFGEDYIINLDWFMNKSSDEDTYQYVSEELREKYYNWKAYRESEEYDGYSSRRDAYREFTKKYNQLMVDINAEMNRLPNDGCLIDYKTYPFDDLNIAYKAYNNALETLEQLYMSDVGAAKFDRGTQEIWDGDGNLITDENKQIKNTFYWPDFCCYYYTIIPNVLNALRMYVWTNDNGVLDPSDPRQMDQETGDWIRYTVGGVEALNPWYAADAKRVTASDVDAYKYDMSLYGTVELKAKQKAWMEAAAALYKPGFVLRNGSVIDPIPTSDYTYNTPNENGWNLLSDTQKEAFTGESNFEKLLNEYLDYVSTLERENSLTKKTTKGVIAMAQEEIYKLQPKIDDMLAEQETWNEKRKAIANTVLLDKWPEFTVEELQVIHSLLREVDYSNSNIVSTNLDNVATLVDIQEELYQDATTALAERSRPQLTFEVDMDNVFALDDYKLFREDMKLLRFIRVGIGLKRDELQKLRIIGIQRNPLVPNDEFSVSFSNMTYSLQGMSDFMSLFDEMGGDSSGSSGGSSSGGGTYGSNDAEIQISNNMLSALLKSKPYLNSVGQVIMSQYINTDEFNNLIAQTGSFKKLQTGDIKVSGDCITDHILSSNYNATEGTGSYLNLKDGTFTYADGKLTWNGSVLHVDGGIEIGNTTGDQIVANIAAMDGKIESAVEKMVTVYATYEDTYTPTTSNYPASQWSTDGVRAEHIGETFYNSSNKHYYIYKKLPTGVRLTLNSNSYTESATYDFIKIYYKPVGSDTYYSTSAIGGNIGGRTINIPTKRFYLYWHTDVSQTYWGFKVDSATAITSGFDTFTDTGSSSLPNAEVIELEGISVLPESAHNYANNTDTIWSMDTGITASNAYVWEDVGTDPGYEIVTYSINTKISQTAEGILFTAEDAAKTATNFLYYNSDGLHIFRSDGSYNSGNNIQITSSAINIRSGTTILNQINADGMTLKNSSGEQLAYFGANTVQIGKKVRYSMGAYSGEYYPIVIKDSDLYGKEIITPVLRTSALGQGDKEALTLVDYYIFFSGNTNIHMEGEGAAGGIKTLVLENRYSSDDENTNYWNISIKADNNIYINPGDYVHINGKITSSETSTNKLTGGNALYITSTGEFCVHSTGSSKRYKNTISNLQLEELDPHKLLDITVSQFKYNDDFLPKDDPRYGKLVPGLIAEDIDKIYPIACDYLEDGRPNNWDERYIIPPMLALIQEQDKRIAELEKRLKG